LIDPVSPRENRYVQLPAGSSEMNFSTEDLRSNPGGESGHGETTTGRPGPPVHWGIERKRRRHTSHGRCSLPLHPPIPSDAGGTIEHEMSVQVEKASFSAEDPSTGVSPAALYHHILRLPEMSDINFDPGLTKSYSGPLRRAINKDGSFNVKRRGARIHDLHIYQFLVSISWPSFAALLLLGYVAGNTGFALLYLWAGIQNLAGADASTSVHSFLSAFFFSTQTFTTVGYGAIAPAGVTANTIASFEAMVGFMSFAIATGLLYGRFSRASARLVFSDTMVVTQHKDSAALMFRVANRRSTTLMEVEARLLFMTVVMQGDKPTRKYDVLELEVPSVYFLPLTWTIVHLIRPGSPLFGKTSEDLAALQAEVLVLIKGYDDTFRQTVHARYSYRHNELLWGRRFTPAFHIDEGGDMVVDLMKISAMDR